jgi:hypothetical protein
VRLFLDEIKGWTVDFGDVSEVFNPSSVAGPSNRCTIPDLADCDKPASPTVLAKAQVPSLSPQLYRVDLRV